MDIFGTVTTVVHEIHVVFLFIRKVVDDVRSYDSDITEMSAQLTVEIAFFEQFKRRYLQDEKGKRFFCDLDQNIQNACNIVLQRISGVLGQYHVEACRHGIDFSLPHTTLANVSSGVAPAASVSALPDDWLTAFNAKLNRIFKDLKKKVFNWSLFDKKTLESMVGSVRLWVTRLRETLTMMKMPTLTESDTRFERIEQSLKRLEGLAIGEAVKRQIIVQESTPEDDFGPLTGAVNFDDSSQGAIGLTTYVEDLTNQPLIFEVKKYDQKLEDAVKSGSSTEIEKAFFPVRQLAWLLRESKFQEGADPDIREGASAQILGLDFYGYLNMPEKLQTVFFYKIPRVVQRLEGVSGSPLVTLYDFIRSTSSNDSNLSLPQQSLGNRYYIAHVLAVTLLNIHCSLWVHKNIRSSVFVMHKRMNTKGPQTREARPVPFVAGWGYARPDSTGSPSTLSADFEIVANLYRHPKRQGQPTKTFNMDHDIYSLGVVLVEIGLWKTVDQLFARGIATHTAKRAVMPDKYFSNWWSSEGRDLLTRSMGEAYAEVVEWCTRVSQPQNTRETKLLRFRDAVIDVLAKGLEL